MIGHNRTLGCLVPPRGLVHTCFIPDRLCIASGPIHTGSMPTGLAILLQAVTCAMPLGTTHTGSMHSKVALLSQGVP